MATSMKKTTVDNVETTETKKATSAGTTKKANKFKDTDLIECRSVTNGAYFFTGSQSKIPYQWADEGDVQSVEYRDLNYAVREKNPAIFKPRIIITDADFIAQNKTVADFYDSMYTVSEFEEILGLPVETMKKVIENLPSGAKDLLKGMVSSRIADGTLDSVKKIKALDSIFDTQMLMMLANN